jgi:predicted Zn-dependent peptidase
MAWHSPAMFAAGDAEADLLADLLANGKTSRLYRTLVYDERVALDVSAFQHSREWAASSCWRRPRRRDARSPR